MVMPMRQASPAANEGLAEAVEQLAADRLRIGVAAQAGGDD